MFIFPTITQRITSHFNKARRHPITHKISIHAGIDIAEKGHHDIMAVADGTVSRSYTSQSYGECIMIKHKINGQTWESVYAHMKEKSRTVAVGDKVKQGQIIGVMGNTGNSTGQHLHFELHKGHWNINKSNAVDPLLYLVRSSQRSYYTVKRGDTLSQIAVDNNTTVTVLADLNGIKNRNLIYAGQRIVLPS